MPKSTRLNSTHYLVMKIPNKRVFQQITFTHSLDIDFQWIAKPYSFLAIDATLVSDNPLSFTEKLLERI